MISQSQVRNHLLRALPEDEFDVLSRSLTEVSVSREDVVTVPNKRIREVHFPETCLMSVIASQPNRNRIEVGIIGKDGMTGMPILVGIDRTPLECFCQVPGNSLKIDADELQTLATKLPAMQAILLRFSHVFNLQVSYTALANGRFKLEERLARWLLMCHDRLEGDEFRLAHQFIALMLGVRRAGVTATMHILEGTGSIRNSRSRVVIVDRPKLEEVAGLSYGAPEAEHYRVFGMTLNRGAGLEDSNIDRSLRIGKIESAH